MQRYFIEIAYLGTNYSGWQIQPNSVTVQAELEKALATLLKEDIITTGAGRTDSGVHASFFVAHFDSSKKNLNWDQNLLFSLNEVLPKDISVKEIVAVKPDAHARFSAISRTYQYRIARSKDPFHIETSWLLKTKLDMEKIKLATDMLLLNTDFSSFCKTGTETKTNNCKIFLATWDQKENQLIFTIRADRFLRNMVRAIVGTLVEVGRNRISPDEFAQIIDLKNRSAAGPSAPPEGLILTNIEYPVDLFQE
ncbi:MAG TPA: tRNA pseudouridine(38-40) synthase TruA [Tenuifilaceae bacterium]|nr:tRNA pseudouridine(38-40) synthase TruA [Tenuifilaceae bacterium]HPE19127.1 tRNA pseudouridine(38-40) synthase TruA [Tenuifilaceae bacterium]HPJ45672.1 tRNA pseudouridine(38-40) synthase TruA [Tenuifilaceae bacterium]HPQ35109.1 tRNA pseudouridine(38-40) synthase TruA [Tenuifilaceae bacterium]HRX68809.1 tRNA pseudouridine(38-40) synthase TruA [Tenuifilaceae bacterium]